MDKIKRYNVDVTYDMFLDSNVVKWTDSNDGTWVKYSDVVDLLKKNKSKEKPKQK